MGVQSSQNLSVSLINGDGSNRIYHKPRWVRSDQGLTRELTLYHGTTIQCATSILKDKMIRPSKGGRLGPGIYFTDDSQVAVRIGTYRSLQRDSPSFAFLTCKIKAKQKYLTQALHPTWKNVTKSSFQQYCLENGQVQIKQAMIGGITSLFGFALSVKL